MSFGLKKANNANYSKNRATAGFKRDSKKSSLTDSNMTSSKDSRESDNSNDSKKHKSKNSRSESGTHNSL